MAYDSNGVYHGSWSKAAAADQNQIDPTTYRLIAAEQGIELVQAKSGRMVRYYSNHHQTIAADELWD